VTDEEFAIALRYPRQARHLRLLIIVAYALLAIGLVAPILTLEKFVVIENTFSVLSGVVQLLHEGQWFLFIIVTGFSVVLPILKLSVLYLLVSKTNFREQRLHRYLQWMHLYGKWSMLDVFVVAILVVAVKLGAIAHVQMRYGLYAFAAAVVLTMLVTARVVMLADMPQRPKR
jgi:paraquat-inducible protein A